MSIISISAIGLIISSVDILFFVMILPVMVSSLPDVNIISIEYFILIPMIDTKNNL